MIRSYLVLLVFVACAQGEERPSFPTSLNPPILIPSADQSWTGVKKGEPIIAWVDDIPIPAGRLRRAMERDPEADPKDLLDAIVAQEALAIEAAGKGVPSDPFIYERALVASLLKEKVGRLTADDMPRSEIEELWAIPAVRARYDHLASFDVQDLQWICCDASPKQCSTEEAIHCFEEGAKRMIIVFEEVSKRSPEPEDIPLIVRDLQVLAPRLTYQEYEFMYDTSKGIQKGRVRFDNAVVNAVVYTPVGKWSKPVRSAFGWHVPYVRNAVPEEHRDISDPVVAREIAEFFTDRFKRKAVSELLGTLVTPTALPSLASYFKNRKMPPPRFDVSVYPDALREAIEAKNRQQEKEGL